MEDFQLDLMIGEGPSAHSIRLDLPRFTLVGATTRAGLLTSPLRDRFGWSARLEYYPVSDLEQIVLRSGRLLGVGIERAAAAEIAGRSRGTPEFPNCPYLDVFLPSSGISARWPGPNGRAVTLTV